MNNITRCPFLTGKLCGCVEKGACGGIQCVNHPLYAGNENNQGSYCPFNKMVMCNGENCDKECYYHPDCEFDADDDDVDDEEIMEAYDAGYNQGFTKGYIERLQEEDEELCEEDWCECRQLGYSQGLDQGYIDGYLECLMCKPCFIKNEEIELLQKLKKR